MTVPQLNERQQIWREQVMEKARKKAGEEAAREAAEKDAWVKQWENVRVKALALREQLWHLAGLTVKTADGKVRRIEVSVQLEEGESEEAWKETTANMIAARVIVHGQGYQMFVYEIQLGSCYIHSEGRPVNKAYAVERAEKWVEEHIVAEVGD